MKVRYKSTMMTFRNECPAEVTTERSISRYGVPVLVVNERPVGPLEAILGGYQFLECTDEEIELLRGGGYLQHG